MKFKERAKSPFEGSSKYIRLKDGESVTGILRGEIYEFHIKWVNGKSVVVDEKDPEAKHRYKINMVVPEEGKFVAKVLEFGSMLYDHLYELSLNMNLEKTKLKLSRKGTGTDTTYIPVPLGPIEEKTLTQLSGVELNILNVQKSEPKHEEPPDFGPMPDLLNDELPF